MIQKVYRRRKSILIFLVFVIALLFRFYRISEYPVSLSIDEVAIGYNAYSILKIGKDEWGKSYPLAFKSVGDYKPPVNIYLTVPSVAIFGLNEFAVRFPVAFLGALTAVLFVLLIREIGFSWFAAIFSGFWLAISPWHVHFSRASFEAITALFFFVLGLYLFSVWRRKPKVLFLLFSIIFLCLSVWAYHAERAFVPVFFLIYILNLRRELKGLIYKKKLFWQISIAALLLLIMSLPFIWLTIFTPAIKTRALATSIFREPGLTRILHYGDYLNWIDYLFNNDIYLIFRHWWGKYLNYFDLRFWFWKGMQFTPPAYPGLGLFYLVNIFPFVLGILFLVRSSEAAARRIFLLWFFLGPLPASLTMNEQHPLRALIWLPAFGILFAAGFEEFWRRKWPTKWTKEFILLGYIVALFFNVIYLADIYFNHFPRHFSEFWQYGFKQIAQYACSQKNNYRQIIISDTFGSEGPLITGIPYAYVLFYCRYEPSRFLVQNRKISGFVFRRPNWNDDKKLKRVLLIGSPWDLSPDKISPEKVVKKIYFLNGKLAFLIVDPERE